MKSFLIHGIYDEKTMKTVAGLGNHRYAYDLRARSQNLITYKNLQTLLSVTSSEEAFLIFENDLKATVNSFLSLLQNASQKFTLIFRDQQSRDYYQEINHAFIWMFHPDADWRSILSLDTAKGVLLPLKYREYFESHAELWNLIQENNLEVYLHAESFEEALTLEAYDGVNLSLELTREVETKYRHVDQEKLGKMRIWRKVNEGLTC